MRTALRFITFATILAVSITASAATSAELLASLRSAVAAEIQTARKAAKGNVPSEKLQVLTGAQRQLQSPISEEYDSGNILRQTLVTLESASGSEKIAQLAKALAEQLAKESHARFQATAQEFDALGKRCAELGFAAKSASELDEPLAELSKALNSSKRSLLNTISNETGVLGTHLNTLATVLQARQDYFLKLEAGDQEDALRLLQQRRYDNGSGAIPWIARSVLLQSYERDRKAAVGNTDDMEARVTALGAKVLAATTAKEIDPILAELAAIQTGAQSSGDGSEKKGAALVRGTLEFTRQWQEFLAARSVGNLEKVRSLLANLTGLSRDYPGIPRSEILARAYGEDVIATDGKKTASPAVLDSPDQVLAKIKTLDDLDRLLPAFQASITSDRNTWSTMSNELLSIARTYRDLRAGNSARVNLNLSGSENREPLASLRGQLAVFALPRILAVGEADRPLANETALTFLRRMIAAARERKDWQFASRILGVMQNAQASDTLLQSGDSAALTNFLAALNYEKAREFALAVNSFQSALKTGSELIPAGDIGERLAAIKRDHAADYEAGLQITLAPPAPRTDAYGRPYPDPRMGFPAATRFGPPNFNAPGEATKEQSIPVPAKKEATSAVQKPGSIEPEPGKK